MHIKDNIASEFDTFSFNYMKDMIACVPYYSTLLTAFTEALPENYSPRAILDLGCGSRTVEAVFQNVLYATGRLCRNVMIVP